MAFSRYFTSKELEAAMEEIVMDEDNNNESQHIDAVCITPDVDTLTDEEDMNDNINLQEFGEPTDIVGTFELRTPNDTAVLQQSCNSSTTEPEWDSSDDETLEFKRRRQLASTVKWKKGQIEYTHTPISDEFKSYDEVIDLILNFTLLCDF
ncbi:uncharacterized protein LOC132705443 [Cylas formicarius]|uniref:uncharacterized protein LOC132705443 n=1 Tax=Cylas formicarius TaxID=197179 RepID=UPI0029586929|nr:uncharacterized protein LOC132705443 [Cylas formicarius]